MFTYDTITWLPGVDAVEANVDTGIEAVPARQAGDKYNMAHMFTKFNTHFGVFRYRSIKRQEFLKTCKGITHRIS